MRNKYLWKYKKCNGTNNYDFCDYDLEQFCIYRSAMKKCGNQGNKRNNI